MPTIIRKSVPALVETRRQILRTVQWQVRSNVWRPPTDVYEVGESFIIKIEIAGMREEDFDVAIESNVLMISGNRPDLFERRAYHQMEIWFGKFEISIDLPAPVDVDKAGAEYKDGFLTVHLPRLKLNQTRVK